VNTLEILEEIPYFSFNKQIVKFLQYCQNEKGGFGGGHWQISHLAPTYSAILSNIFIHILLALLLVGT
jgi:prenyltransferase beta subunit